MDCFRCFTPIAPADRFPRSIHRNPPGVLSSAPLAEPEKVYGVLEETPINFAERQDNQSLPPTLRQSMETRRNAQSPANAIRIAGARRNNPR